MANLPVVHLDMDPRASDFLELLRDLGHLDDAAIERLTARLLQQGGDRAGRRPVVGFEEVRRATAQLLFEGEDSMKPEARDLLWQEWGRLFH